MEFVLQHRYIATDEVIIENGQLKELTIYGMINYLQSEEK